MKILYDPRESNVKEKIDNFKLEMENLFGKEI